MFQFPRFPPGHGPGARYDHGRVAPFGHPRITDCQRLPGAFRRVAASFIGLVRLGIHPVPSSGSSPQPRPNGRAGMVFFVVRAVTPMVTTHPAPPVGVATFSSKKVPTHSQCPPWSRGDSNPGPPPCKGGALPAKLRPHPIPARHPLGVGAPGLEPGTSALSGPRSNQLSYAPVGHRCVSPHIGPDLARRCAEDEAAGTGSPPAASPDVTGASTPPGRPRRAAKTVARLHRTPELGPPAARFIGHRPDLGECIPRKEVIQPQLPLRLPCYDFVPITSPTLDSCAPEGFAHRLQVLPAFMT